MWPLSPLHKVLTRSTYLSDDVDLDLLVYKLYCPWKIEPTVGRVCV